jgi:hypothetical protein
MSDIIDQNHPANLPAEIAQTPVASNPFQRMQQVGGGMNAAVVEIESQRAIAEAQGKQLLARKFPRSMTQAMADFMEACKIPEFAAVAFYAVPNRGSGPSIRFAEEAARCYGNFEFGHRELSRDKGRSVIEVYAWDTEKGNHSVRQLTVEHVVDTKNGPKVLRDQADIDNRIANVASKQMRGRILALLPKGLVMAGQEACKRTLAGNSEKPISQRINDMVQVFGRFGVTVKHLETKLGHSLDTTTVDELADLVGIFNALKEGAKASEYFELPESDASASTAAALTQAAKTAAASAPPAQQASAPSPAASPAPAAPKNSKTTQQASKPAKAAEPPPPVEPPPPAAAASDKPDMPPAGPDDGDVF